MAPAYASLYQVAVLTTIAIVGWCALDVWLDPARRRRLACVGVLSVAAFLWSAGTLLLIHAGSPAELLAARRLLFAGVCLLPAAWVWCALVAAYPHAPALQRRRFYALLAPGLAVYACLYVAPGAFIDWYSEPIRRGPVYYANAVYSWTLIALGAGILLRATRRSAGGSLAQQISTLAGVALPLLANGAYVVLGALPWPWDPTPIALGFSAALFRVRVVDVTWAAQHPPVARAEVVAQMQDAVLVADRTRRVVDWNVAAAEMIGASIAEGRSLDELLHGLSQRGGRSFEVREFPLRRRGTVFGVGAVVTDRSAQRAAEIRLEMATRLEALGYLTAGVAHEINNPLTYLSANLGFLEPWVEAVSKEAGQNGLSPSLRTLGAEAPMLLADAREGTERIQRVVERLSHFSQARAPGDAPQALDVGAVVARSVAMASFGKRETPIVVRTQEAVVAQASESDVIHIVFHLLLNAMQMGGDDVAITVTIDGSAEEVSVRVADKGPGIAEHDLPHLFEPFYTTRRPGEHLGLGLAMCWELARRSGGRLEAENRPGSGAAFTLWLPAERQV
jgi:two-component system NtrC family sensor kinase